MKTASSYPRSLRQGTMTGAGFHSSYRSLRQGTMTGAGFHSSYRSLRQRDDDWRRLSQLLSLPAARDDDWRRLSQLLSLPAARDDDWRRLSQARKYLTEITITFLEILKVKPIFLHKIVFVKRAHWHPLCDHSQCSDDVSRPVQKFISVVQYFLSQ